MSNLTNNLAYSLTSGLIITESKERTIFDARMTSHKELIQATAFQNHHGRHFANGAMADGLSTVFGHLFPGPVSLYKANL